MTNERSIEILRDLLVTIDNGGVMYFEKELKELREAVGVAIKSLQAKYLIDADGKIYPLPKNPFPNATSVTIPPIKLGKWKPTSFDDVHICSECGYRLVAQCCKDYKFCFNCGAKMED